METEKQNYKGYTIEIIQDETAQSPDEWEDKNLFLVAYHRDFNVEKKDIISKEEAQAIGSGDYESYDTGSGYFKQNCKTIEKKYHIFGLEAYIHSGVVLALSYEGNFPDRQWDVSQLGLVLVAKTEAKTRVKARKLAVGLIEEWNDCLSGNVWGYRVQETGDSVWGFYGDWEESGLLESARESIDYHIQKVKEKNAKKLKAYILRGVPLEKRELTEK